MSQKYGQIIVTDDYTRLAIDMNNINTIIILSGRRSTFLQGQIQNTRILSEKVAWELYYQTNRKANVYYVAFEYDDRIQHIINDTYLKENLEHSITYARLGLNQGINNLYSVMSQVQAIQTGTTGSSTTQQAPKFNPIALTIAIT
jgi:tagatose-1,6-bisphosphate aldolase non-catalytic subunit AgaZ/GatZ